MPRSFRNLPTTVLGIAFTTLLHSSAVRARTVACNPIDQAAISEAITLVEQSLDPCGDSEEVLQLLDKVQHSPAIYRICTDVHADRNSFDRVPEGDGRLSRTITWNPDLRNALELGCDGDPNKPVLRDPSASLLHELAHAAQDVDGLEPTEHEMEAVRIENIYRRAAGMCQRAHYGSDPLPRRMIRTCDADSCACTPPRRAAQPQLASIPPARGKASRKHATAPADGSAAVIRRPGSTRH